MTDQDYLQLALDQAKESVQQGGFPAGAVLVKDNHIIAQGVSLGFKLNDPTSHAETVTIRQACQKLKTTDLAEATLYASLQPCVMCFSVANWANLDKIVYGCKKNDEMVVKHYYEGHNDLEAINSNNTHHIELIYLPIFETEVLRLIQKWEAQFS